jgi:large subunit ribosomal protein L16
MLSGPKRSKYKKQQKGKAFNKIKLISSLKNQNFSKIKIISVSSGRISANQIKAIKAIIRKGTKKRGIVKSNLFPYNSITKKPNEIRMGKGKGAISHWVFNSKMGIVLFEIKTKSPQKIKNLLNKVKKRLSIRVKIL